MTILDSLMMQLRAAVNRGSFHELNYYHLGRIHGFLYNAPDCDKKAAYRNEAMFLVNEYARRNGK